jgi:hypothetical protein
MTDKRCRGIGLIYTADDNDQQLSDMKNVLKYKISPFHSKASRHQDECVVPYILILSTGYRPASREEPAEPTGQL